MTTTNHRIGQVNYELNNHLGNVLSVVSDKPIPHDNSGTADYWLAEIKQGMEARQNYIDEGLMPLR